VFCLIKNVVGKEVAEPDVIGSRVVKGPMRAAIEPMNDEYAIKREVLLAVGWHLRRQSYELACIWNSSSGNADRVESRLVESLIKGVFVLQKCFY
jgi:hypothetical protein